MLTDEQILERHRRRSAQVTTVRFPDEIAAEIARRARSAGVPRGAIVKQLVQAALDGRRSS